VNRTLVLAYLRQRLTSPMRLGILVLFTVFPLGAVVFMRTLSPLDSLAGLFAFVFAAGAIGQDVSSGTLQLLLVRPVSRPSLLVHRWLASVLGAVGMVVAILALGTLALLARGMHPDGLDLVRILLESVSSAAGYAAVVVALSALVGGLGDVALWFLTFIFAQMLSGIAMFEHWDWLGRASTELQGVLAPTLSWAWLVHGSPPPLFALASWASTVTLALAVGITRLNRRELSYAAG